MVNMHQGCAIACPLRSLQTPRRQGISNWRFHLFGHTLLAIRPSTSTRWSLHLQSEFFNTAFTYHCKVFEWQARAQKASGKNVRSRKIIAFVDTVMLIIHLWDNLHWKARSSEYLADALLDLFQSRKKV